MLPEFAPRWTAPELLEVAEDRMGGVVGCLEREWWFVVALPFGWRGSLRAFLLKEP
jgi:hypothetical protein